MSEPLLIVDVQKGFINSFTHHIPQRIARLIERGEHNPLLFTRFINLCNGPYQQLLNWYNCDQEPETSIVPELEPFAQKGYVFSKQGRKRNV